MTTQECYTLLKGNYQEAKSRLMNDTLIDRFLLRFPDDPSMQQLLDSLSQQNYTEAFHAAHTLKGVAANLAFTQLQQSASALTEALRGGQCPADASLLPQLQSDYQLVMDTIKLHFHTA